LDTKEGNRRLHYKGWLLSAAAVVSILLALNISFMVFNSKQSIITESAPRVLITDFPAEQLYTLSTNKGVKAFAELPDGTKVWLNSDSKLTFPYTFLGPTREVALSGEVFFDVAQDSLSPMIITTNRGFMVKVLGTKFNIKSYANDSEARTTLLSGALEIIKIEMVAGKLKQTSIVLNNQQSYIVSDNESTKLVPVSDTIKQTAWRNGKLIFDYTPLTEVIKQLERWHGVEFLVEDRAAYDIKLTAEFEQESIIQIMEMIKFCSTIDYQIQDRRKIKIFLEK
jgi:ferric-dicitrate binding protein FerR (iron transport regulator)